MTFRILLVDDEEPARRRMRRFLEKTTDPVHIEEAVHGKEALEAIAAFEPHIVFLDVEMPVLSGLDVLANLEERPFRVIFQTAHREFALRAFEENACDYLLKPYTEERFLAAYERSKRELRESGAIPWEAEKAALSRQDGLQVIAVRNGSTLRLLSVARVWSFRSEDKYVVLETEEGEFLCDLSLNHLEARLPQIHYVRVHRSAIVDLRRVISVHQGENATLQLESGRVFPISRSRRAEVFARLKERCGQA